MDDLSPLFILSMTVILWMLYSSVVSLVVFVGIIIIAFSTECICSTSGMFLLLTLLIRSIFFIFIPQIKKIDGESLKYDNLAIWVGNLEDVHTNPLMIVYFENIEHSSSYRFGSFRLFHSSPAVSPLFFQFLPTSFHFPARFYIPKYTIFFRSQICWENYSIS